MTLDLGDFGHPRASNPPATLAARNARIAAFLGNELGVTAGALVPGSVFARLTECRSGAAPTDVTAASYAALHPGQLLLAGDGTSRRIRSSGGDRALAESIKPVGGSAGGACGQVPFRRTAASGTAQSLVNVRRPVTLLGSPAVAVRVRTAGSNGQLVARLWDVDRATRRQRLVSRGVYRLERNQNRSVLFQLSANGYRFAAGHALKLELLGRDAPSFRPSSTAFTAGIELRALQIPTRERASKARGTTRYQPLRLRGGL